MERLEFDAIDYPVYLSSTIIHNDDGTYKVKHIFKHKESQIEIIYPRIQFEGGNKIEIMIDGMPSLFPFTGYKILPDNDDKLFIIEEKTQANTK